MCNLNRASGIEYLLAAVRASRARRGARLLKKIGNLWFQENLIMTLPHARKTIRTDAEGRRKKIGRVGKGMLDMYLGFHSGARLTIFGATNVVARMKNLD